MSLIVRNDLACICNSGIVLLHRVRQLGEGGTAPGRILVDLDAAAVAAELRGVARTRGVAVARGVLVRAVEGVSDEALAFEFDLWLAWRGF